MNTTSQAFKYPECKKGQFHIGQALSLVCIEPKCIQNSVICGICYNQDHKNHKIKPLKIVINNSRKYLDQLTPMNIDTKQIQESVNQQKKSLLSKFQQFQKHVISSLANIKESINAIYIKISQKIDLKTGSKDQLIKTLDQIKQQELENEKFISLMKKLLAGVPLQNEEQSTEASSKQLQDSINSLTKKIEKSLVSKSDLVKKQINNLSDIVKKLAGNPGIFHSTIQFKFSTELKHHGVDVLSDTLVKSVEGYNYHFGLMEPCISQKPLCVQFKIKQSGSNWIAVGLCHKNVVQANNYQFSYSNLGHGGYLISSNGGSWSSIDTNKNNVVTSFNFTKNDIVILKYTPEDNKILFCKKGTEESHTLQVEPKQDDELHLCCLFYYSNDEVQYLGYEDDQ